MKQKIPERIVETKTGKIINNGEEIKLIGGDGEDFSA